jgi:hypothetical protein
MRFFFVAVVVGGLWMVGCGDEPAKKSKIVEVAGTDPNKSKSPSKSSSTSDEYDDSLDDSTPEDPSAEAPPEDPPGTPDPEEPPPDPTGPKTATCTSQEDGHKSVAEIVYEDDNGTFKITSMTVLVTNKDHRNKNDVDVYVTPKGGSEGHIFNSGDVLADGKKTMVTLPSNFTVKPGSRLRVETNFDESFADAAASCNIQL